MGCPHYHAGSLVNVIDDLYHAWLVCWTGKNEEEKKDILSLTSPDPSLLVGHVQH